VSGTDCGKISVNQTAPKALFQAEEQFSKLSFSGWPNAEVSRYYNSFCSRTLRRPGFSRSRPDQTGCDTGTRNCHGSHT
jgi:hypothetical protein